MLVYKKVYDYVTNSWVELPFNTDPKDTIKVKIDVEKWRKNGRIIGGEKTKSFTEEETEDTNDKDNKENER
jgi:hypothetical protein